jgi:type II secretion system protein N
MNELLSATANAMQGSPRRQMALLIVFGVVCFLLCLLITFPYDALKERLVAEASENGLYLRLESVQPGFFSVNASNLQLSKKLDDVDAKPSDPLKVSSISLSPSFFPLGLGFDAHLLSGEVSGAIGNGSESRVKLNVTDLNLADPSFEAITGVKATGKLGGTVDFRVPTETLPGGQSSAAMNFAHTQGTASFHGEQIAIEGGSITIPFGGGMVPFDLPAASLGNLVLLLKVDNGAGTFQQFSLSGGDFQVNGSGTLRVDRQLPYSDLNLDLKLKAEADFQKRLGLLGSGLTMLPQDSSQPGWRTARMLGKLGSPQFVAGR